MRGGRQTARAWPKAACRAMRSARPAPGAALVSRALVCGACAGVRLRSPLGSALARGQSRGRSVNRQSAHRPALDRRAARAIILFARRQPAKAPIGFACRPRRKGRLRPLFGGRRSAGAERLGPKRSRARRIAQSGWPRRPPASAGRFFLLAFFACDRPFVFSAFFSCAMRPSRKKTRSAALSAPFLL